MSTNGKDDPPNLDTIIKLMGMTTSSHDGEALNAMRMANAQLKKWNWTWREILTAKIKIMPDPFANIPSPTTGQSGTGYMRPQAAPTPPPKQFDNANEIEKYFDKVNMPGRKFPHDIAQRLGAVERTWNANGFLLYKDYDFLRNTANSRRRY